jgi:hypothetical protein
MGIAMVIIIRKQPMKKRKLWQRVAGGNVRQLK